MDFFACKQCLICAYFSTDSDKTDLFFKSAVWTYSDGTHSLQRIHWWASDVWLNLSKSVLMKKQTYLHLEWPEGEQSFNFGWTIPSFVLLIKLTRTLHPPFVSGSHPSQMDQFRPIQGSWRENIHSLLTQWLGLNWIWFPCYFLLVTPGPCPFNLTPRVTDTD